MFAFWEVQEMIHLSLVFLLDGDGNSELVGAPKPTLRVTHCCSALCVCVYVFLYKGLGKA